LLYLLSFIGVANECTKTSLFYGEQGEKQITLGVCVKDAYCCSGETDVAGMRVIFLHLSALLREGLGPAPPGTGAAMDDYVAHRKGPGFY
jgi:hypothetical protein